MQYNMQLNKTNYKKLLRPYLPVLEVKNTPYMRQANTGRQLQGTDSRVIQAKNSSDGPDYICMRHGVPPYEHRATSTDYSPVHT